MSEPRRAHLRHVTIACAVAAALVVGSTAQADDGVLREGQPVAAYDEQTAARLAAQAEAEPHTHTDSTEQAGDGHGHDHNDPATKNAVSRSTEQTVDPTTPEQARAHTAYVAEQRVLREPPLTTAPVRAPRHSVPRTRYEMAGGCYTLRAPSGGYVVETDAGLAVAKRSRRHAARFFFQATTLGKYLLYGTDRDFVSGPGATTMAADPSARAVWTVRRPSDRFTFRLGAGEWLRVSQGELTTAATATTFALRVAGGCARYPESQVGVSGRPHAGVSPYQEVRGYVDAHTHGMAFEFLGGAHCGRPWHEYGAPYALVDCPDHQAGVNPLEAALSGEPAHDPVGWPTFADWPAPESLTHEGTYYKWVERAWRGGQRILVNLLVENNQLCRLYPPVNRPDLTSVTCDEMESLERQARDMWALQDYVDAQAGGPGRGWYRIVTNPWQARKVINAGKLAVVMGIETSVPFGCTMKLDLPQCDERTIDEQLATVRGWGVRQMELVNKFDNALAGVAGDSGTIGPLVNTANFLETGSFWDMRHCEPADGESADRTQVTALPGQVDPQAQDAIFGALVQAYGALGTALPLYPSPLHCNRRGLTDLGAHLVDRLADRYMLFDPDHMSVKARDAALDRLEARGYAGVISSHSWSTPDAYPRIYRLGGFVAPYAGDSTGFVGKWRRHLTWADERYYFGIGFGADINGLGAQGDPRGAGAKNPVAYPFTGLGGVEIRRQRAGRRVFDLNTDGVAQYGLYPDWIEDLRHVADTQQGDGRAIVDDLARGAEAYLQTWERAHGIAPDSCRNPGLRLRIGAFRKRVRPGLTLRQVMRAVGQPYQRLGSELTYCAETRSGARRTVALVLSARGRVTDVR